LSGFVCDGAGWDLEGLATGDDAKEAGSALHIRGIPRQAGVLALNKLVGWVHRVDEGRGHILGGVKAGAVWTCEHDAHYWGTTCTKAALVADLDRELRENGRTPRWKWRTTTTNWEFSGYLSWKLSDVESLKGRFMIFRASMLLGRGDGPKVWRRAWYGGLPPSPETWRESVSHCFGVLVKFHVYALAELTNARRVSGHMGAAVSVELAVMGDVRTWMDVVRREVSVWGQSHSTARGGEVDAPRKKPHY
jgi:hypothetical protein